MRKVIVTSVINKDYHINESYKTLRANLMFCGDDIKTVIITSCDENEGKTTVSIELAKSIAEAGKRVLLIDADLRKSVVRERYLNETDQGVGLSEFLSGQAELEDVLCATQDSNMFLMTSGSFPPNPVELLGSQKFQNMLESSRKTFDYVIIDTPPLGLVIDSAVAAKSADGVLLVMNAGKNHARLVRSVIDQLGKSGCRLLGGIFNNVQTKKDLYYRHYYHRYYRGYYSGRKGYYGKRGGYDDGYGYGYGYGQHDENGKNATSKKKNK